MEELSLYSIYVVGVMCSILFVFLFEILVEPSKDLRDARGNFFMAFFWPLAVLLELLELLIGLSELLILVTALSATIALFFFFVHLGFELSSFSASAVIIILFYVYTLGIISRKSALAMALISSIFIFGGQYIYYTVIL